MPKKDYSNLFRLTPKAEGQPEEPPATAGAVLKAERLNRGLSLEEVAAATSISVRSLRALEENDREKLPAKAFIRGFIIIYARYLGLNPDEILGRYNQSKAQAGSPSDEINAHAIVKLNPGSSKIPFFLKRLALLLGGVALLLLCYWGYTSYQSEPARREAATERPAVPAGQNEQAVVPAPEEK
jgi:cytoskeletal protein RodZ